VIYHEGRLEKRVLVGGVMTSAALTSFLTGITELIMEIKLITAVPDRVSSGIMVDDGFEIVPTEGIIVSRVNEKEINPFPIYERLRFSI
jgi:phosphotransferase system IIA component